MIFNLLPMKFSCSRNHLANAILQIGLTSHQCLWVEWQCLICRKKVQCIVPLEKMMNDAPYPPFEVSDADQQFLREMKINLEDSL